MSCNPFGRIAAAACGSVVLALCAQADPATPRSQSPAQTLYEKIAYFATMHGVPESLVHRVVKRESRYNPHLVHHHNLGLMQIKYGTACTMGYKGTPNGLLDPEVNLTYAVPYLANAYLIAEGDENRAVNLYAGGYYYLAKRKHMLASLRTADSPPASPVAPLYQVAATTIVARSDAPAASPAIEDGVSGSEAFADAASLNVPLPPARPKELRFQGKVQLASADPTDTADASQDIPSVNVPLPPPRPISVH